MNDESIYREGNYLDNFGGFFLWVMKRTINEMKFFPPRMGAVKYFPPMGLLYGAHPFFYLFAC